MGAPFTPLVESLPATVPFTGPETLERRRGAPFDARIGANESASGMSPLAIRALAAAVGGRACALYGDPENRALRERLADGLGVGLESVVVGPGIDSLLGTVVRMFLAPGEVAVSSLGAYPTFDYHVAGHGGRLERVAYRADARVDVEALAAAARGAGARLVYLSSPDNPTGTQTPARALADLADRLPDGCLLVLDEAYLDYPGPASAPPIDASDDRVLRLRTFSKAWGMAGLRVGYAVGHPDAIAGFDKVRDHFGVNRLAQVAALASVGDEGFLERVRAEVAAGRERIVSLAARHGLDHVASVTNFVAVDLGDAGRAQRALEALHARGVFVRKPMAAPLDRHVRIGVGTAEEMVRLEAVFGDALAEALDARPRRGGTAPGRAPGDRVEGGYRPKVDG